MLLGPEAGQSLEVLLPTWDFTLSPHDTHTAMSLFGYTRDRMWVVGHKESL